ncbi:MAG TPA: translation initiation factor IF-2 [Anaeromyxobacter sp.]
MAVKNRPASAREALSRQQADFRRGAPGKRFVGERAGQGEAARLAERTKVAQMAERDEALRRARKLSEPIAAIVAELVEDSFRLVRSLATAPFRIARALLVPRQA